MNNSLNFNKNNTFCIVIPPPNITGYLHMGHAFQCTLMDILVRYQKMNGFSVLWKMGVDHAGIATQILIEKKILVKDKVFLFNFGYKWKKKSFKKIKSQLLNLNFSLNFETSRFTLDNHFSYAVRKAFILLYEDGLIYKEKKLVNWDISIKSAVSDLETIYSEEFVNLYYIKYKILGENDFLLISTTRPETIFADSAVALNSFDIRRQFLLNKNLEIPIIKKVIPIIFDEKVDINFGSGCLKITPAHDFFDFDIGIKHKLEILNIFNSDGSLNDNVPKNYVGLSILNARKKIVDELSSLGLIEKIVSYKTKIPRADRSNSIIEPFLTDQWYVKTKPLIFPVLNVIKNNKVKIKPEKWKKTFIDWSENIKDWCVSRQIWWGHKIPVWYDYMFNIYVGENEKIVRKKYNLLNIPLHQEEDVLDTWFSSALWPFASLGWPLNKKEFLNFYPTDVLVTGFDIIFFWVIRMLMFGLKFTNQVPFKEIYIHGLIRDHLGNKMSKTKGNVIDPIDVINGITFENLLKKRTLNLINDKDKEIIIRNTKNNFPNGISSFGVDPLRLSFVSLATDNMYLNFNLDMLDKYKKFCTKILNANNFISSKLNFDFSNFYKNNISSIYNIAILSLWQRIKKILNSNLKYKKFSNFLINIYNFFWHDFCDWYIEFSKILFKSVRFFYITANFIKEIYFEILLSLYPLIPNLISNILNSTKLNTNYLNYPKCNFSFINLKKESIFNDLKQICSKLRNLKNLINFNSNIIIFIKFINKSYIRKFEKIKPFICKICNLSNIIIIDDNQLNINYIKIFFINFFLFFQYSSLVCDISFIKRKIDKKKIEKNIIENKLKDDKFLKNAKLEIINEKKEKLKKINSDLLSLENIIF